MTYYKDLTIYEYTAGLDRPGNNIGWLARGRPFPTAIPDEDVLDLIWLFCAIHVQPTRGFHVCELCLDGSACDVERNGERRLLGTAEIRVFSGQGHIYAAPTLIYHYVAVHQYKPPDGFLRAVREGPRPPSQRYFDELAKLAVEWNKTAR